MGLRVTSVLVVVVDEQPLIEVSIKREKIDLFSNVEFFMVVKDSGSVWSCHFNNRLLVG